MKKCLLIVAALLLIAALSFADMAASTYMTGSLYGTDGFVLANQNQKDADMLTFSIYNEKTGAYFRLWTDLLGDSSTVHMRSAKVWWKPLSMLTLSIGEVGGYGYTEQLDWWKVPTGSSLAQASSWENRWASNSTGEAGGIQVEVEPVKGLMLTGGVYPGIGNNFGSLEGEDQLYDADTAYGIQAKYNIPGFGSALASFKDTGKEDFKIARVGFDVNAIPNLYAFLTGIFYMDDHTAAYAGEDADGMILRGVAIDNYIKYTIAKATIEARCPVTLRLTDDDTDVSFLMWRARVKYDMGDGINPYFNAEAKDFVPVVLSEVADTLSISIRPGVLYYVEKAEFDLGIQVDVDKKGGDYLHWSIPFRARVSF